MAGIRFFMNVSSRTLLLLVMSCPALVLGQSLAELQSAFKKPPLDTRPGCYWYWINDNISKAGITKDLEAMARVGIGRAYIGQIYTHKNVTDTPVGSVKFMSDEWWDAMQWAVKEADRCGIEIGFFNSPGWSQSGGPWVKPAESMRYLAASETVVTGGQKVDQVLRVPEIKTFPVNSGIRSERDGEFFTEKDFQDVRVVAFRQPETETADMDMSSVKISSSSVLGKDLLPNKLPPEFAVGPQEWVVDFELDGYTPVQSLRIIPLEQGYTLTCVVMASEDGKNFHELTRHIEERGHQGPRNKDPLLIPFPETKAKYLRVSLVSSKAVTFSDLSLSRRAVLANYVRKQLGETSPSVRPPWNAYIWPDQSASTPGSVVDSASVIDLTSKMDATGRLVWDAPPGKWLVLRTGMIPIGVQCTPSSPESRGLEVDKMNRTHIRSLFDGMVGEFLRRTPASERKALKYVIADSYETGPQNWTDGMVEKFQKRFGYSPVKFLPCLEGRVVDSPEITTRFLWDWRRLVVESIAYDYVGGLRDVAHEHNLTLWLENYGHWGFPSEFLLYGSQSDQVGGEFWENLDPLNQVECRAAASAAHIYGMKDVYAEAFTSGRTFPQSPASFKNWLDWVYGTGVNHLILHVYIHQPDERKPGIIQWFGTAFNRHNTWFEQSKAFIDYTRRCSVLLKAGRPVIDIAYYIGENAPAMAGPNDPTLPDGYDFDYMNSDVLMNRAKVVDGKITFPGGSAYSVLVLPRQNVMRPEVVSAIRRLIRDGATVVGPKPVSSPSLADYPKCDQTVQAIAEEVWADVDGVKIQHRRFGQGNVFDGVSLENVLAKIGVLPDVLVDGDPNIVCAAVGLGRIGIRERGGIIFKHRATEDGEIYFLANTSSKPLEFTASLRTGGRQPELWNADSGDINKAAAFQQKEGRSLIPLRLAPSESIFVVLREPIAADVAGPADSNGPEFAEVSSLVGPWVVRFAGLGAPKETIFETLTDWTKHPDPSIQNYSGTAEYEIHFNLAELPEVKRTVLELGRAADIATIIVNGQSVGTVWTSPWKIDISRFVQRGKNTLQVSVANSWNNRLVADSELPLEQRLTYVSEPYRFDKNHALLESGLIGPVRILQEKETDLKSRNLKRSQ